MKKIITTHFRAISTIIGAWKLSIAIYVYIALQFLKNKHIFFLNSRGNFFKVQDIHIFDGIKNLLKTVSEIWIIGHWPETKASDH